MSYNLADHLDQIEHVMCEDCDKTIMNCTCTDMNTPFFGDPVFDFTRRETKSAQS